MTQLITPTTRKQVAEIQAIESDMHRLRAEAAALSVALRAILARQDAWRIAVLVADEFRRAKRMEALLCAVEHVLEEVDA